MELDLAFSWLERMLDPGNEVVVHNIFSVLAKTYAFLSPQESQTLFQFNEWVEASKDIVEKENCVW